MANEEQALTIPQQAEKALAFAETSEKLIALAKESERIVEISSPAAYAECHGARMKLKNQRIEIQRIAKGAREDATAFSKQVIAVEKKLVDLISPEEERLERLQNSEDDRKAAEKQAKIDAENARVDGHLAALNEIHRIPLDAMNFDADGISKAIDELEARDLSEDAFEEFSGEAAKARAAALARLEGMALARRQDEERAAALKAQEAELERREKRERILRGFLNVVALAPGVEDPADLDKSIGEFESLPSKEADDELEIARLAAIADLKRIQQEKRDAIARRAEEQEAAAKRRALEEVRDRILADFRRMLEGAASSERARIVFTLAALSAIEVPAELDELGPEVREARENALSELRRLERLAIGREVHEAEEARQKAAQAEQERLARVERDRLENEQREQRRRDEEAESARRAQLRREEEELLARRREAANAEAARLAEIRERLEREEIERRAGETELLPAAAAVLELCDVEGLGSRPEVVLLRLVIGRQSAPAPEEVAHDVAGEIPRPARSCAHCGAVEPFPHEDGCEGEFVDESADLGAGQ